MTVKDILDKMDNGACHVILIGSENAEVILKTIWHNTIPEECLNYEVKHICITDYTMRLTVYGVGNI